LERNPGLQVRAGLNDHVGSGRADQVETKHAIGEAKGRVAGDGKGWSWHLEAVETAGIIRPLRIAEIVRAPVRVLALTGIQTGLARFVAASSGETAPPPSLLHRRVD
jgi:hypothetical protein